MARQEGVELHVKMFIQIFLNDHTYQEFHGHYSLLLYLSWQHRVAKYVAKYSCFVDQLKPIQICLTTTRGMMVCEGISYSFHDTSETN